MLKWFNHSQTEEKMGRHAGEDYETQVPCSPEKHEFAMNGTCWGCRHTKRELVNAAIRTIKLHGTEEQKMVVQNIALSK